EGSDRPGLSPNTGPTASNRETLAKSRDLEKTRGRTKGPSARCCQVHDYCYDDLMEKKNAGKCGSGSGPVFSQYLSRFNYKEKSNGQLECQLKESQKYLRSLVLLIETAPSVARLGSSRRHREFHCSLASLLLGTRNCNGGGTCAGGLYSPLSAKRKGRPRPRLAPRQLERCHGPELRDCCLQHDHCYDRLNAKDKRTQCGFLFGTYINSVLVPECVTTGDTSALTTANCQNQVPSESCARCDRGVRGAAPSQSQHPVQQATLKRQRRRQRVMAGIVEKNWTAV
uniref:PA2c domain-containing protein n=1 Tax=Macrostomum lignano TaxID=282301 RepID=A0A1I8FPH9_9PLAT